MNAVSLRFVSLPFPGALAVCLAACGAGAGAKAPTSLEADAEPTTIEEAQSQISRARATLAAPHEEAQPSTPGRATPAGGDVSRQAEPSPPPAESSTTESPPRPAKTAPSLDGTSCSSPCRALASMRRAVSALCRMTGDTDGRCLDAKRTLAESAVRIACSC